MLLGINIFLDGFIPTENLRFRDESLSFRMQETADELILDKTRRYSYPSMNKTIGSFKLTVEGGEFTDSEIIVMLGENGTGKTTFIKLLAGDTPDVETDKQTLNVSLKPQKIAPKFPGSVRALLLKQIRAAFMHPQFQTDVVKPMSIEPLLDNDVQTLSGGELQRVAIVLALGKPVSNIAVRSSYHANAGWYAQGGRLPFGRAVQVSQKKSTGQLAYVTNCGLVSSTPSNELWRVR